MFSAGGGFSGNIPVGGIPLTTVAATPDGIAGPSYPSDLSQFGVIGSPAIGGVAEGDNASADEYVQVPTSSAVSPVILNEAGDRRSGLYLVRVQQDWGEGWRRQVYVIDRDTGAGVKLGHRVVPRLLEGEWRLTGDLLADEEASRYLRIIADGNITRKDLDFFCGPAGSRRRAPDRHLFLAREFPAGPACEAVRLQVKRVFDSWHVYMAGIGELEKALAMFKDSQMDLPELLSGK